MVLTAASFPAAGNDRGGLVAVPHRRSLPDRTRQVLSENHKRPEFIGNAEPNNETRKPTEKRSLYCAIHVSPNSPTASKSPAQRSLKTARDRVLGLMRYGATSDCAVRRPMAAGSDKSSITARATSRNAQAVAALWQSRRRSGCIDSAAARLPPRHV